MEDLPQVATSPIPAIEVRGLQKLFPAVGKQPQPLIALNGVNLTVNRGEIFGILGPNGAGKTTLINILAGLLLPDAGTVHVLGEDMCLNGRQLRQRLNLCSGNPNFPWSLTVRENLHFYAMLYGVRGQQRDQRVREALELLELMPVADRQYDTLSTGTKQRLALAKALINRPELLFLDEPTMGLDPDIAQRIRHFVLAIHQERKFTIVVTTHYMAEAEQLCGRIAFLKAGRLHALGTAQELIQLAEAATLEEAFLRLAGEGGHVGP
ncbi:MAG: ABC transporter ATP-binding protein [Elusimicrobia bacterium]|nr:ABC transporter ATP-binding protein [Elusimicrobiota bacterium]